MGPHAQNQIKVFEDYKNTHVAEVREQILEPYDNYLKSIISLCLVAFPMTADSLFPQRSEIIYLPLLLYIDGFHGSHVGDQNNVFSLIWEKNSIFMQMISIVADYHQAAM